MPRQRFIWPDLWTDSAIGRLEPVVQLFFIGCFSNADDDGRLLADPAYLRATIFPYQDFGLDEVREIRSRAVAGCRNLELYEVDGVEYLVFHRWHVHQKPKYPKPSKLPPPPRKAAQTKGKSSGNDGGTLEEEGGNVPESFPPRVGLGKSFKASPSFVAEASYEEPASDAENLNALQSMKERIGREMPQ